ncbi:CU044_5270 family protein [Hamadaea tsunoensis]|uniref:CU044_5270 family protein n=1 Tax=Hamadaea tsunoensis TaxID=53368 RepID=UPI0003F6AF30|nr:CU044_5270 family protein [Hamadaea tsunoensis]
MTTEQTVRDLLGPADPARGVTIAPARRSAADLMAAGDDRRSRPTRRLVLAGGALAAAAAVAAVALRTRSTVDDGTVLVPVAYQFGDEAPAARQELLALAARLTDAAYEHHTGQYAYHLLQSWGDPVVTAPDGRSSMSYALRIRTWLAADGSGRQITDEMQREYPDAGSRAYWSGRPSPIGGGSTDLSATPVPPLPDSPAGLTQRLKVEYGGGAVAKEVATVYAEYAVPKATRAAILRVLADVPGWVWRGNVTDRAGRAGVAVTFDDRVHHQQNLLVFDPGTGGLLAHELVTLLAPVRISAYQLILATDRTGAIGS